VRRLFSLIEFVGKVSSFGVRVIVDGLRVPFEGSQILNQITEMGSKSLPLIVPAGFALGTVMTFGAGAMIPTVQALAFFVEIGPLVAGFLLAGRVGSGIGAVLANMRVTEQIDAIESLSIDSLVSRGSQSSRMRRGTALIDIVHGLRGPARRPHG
jgi:phospholipid/cholesterol/gamma-HCH transport system permease protein